MDDYRAKFIVASNMPTHFSSKALDQWAYNYGVTLDFSRPEKSTGNPHIESFNRGLRDECLNLHWFCP
ncbi:Integrase core domain-containing protein [Fodinibius roseus]|uniref:Integrase core domain-containing protein n=1 Tax=Fodinibius roseus TaxID=1194090 RepID=A0A1M4ZE06_9BACT|nr:Integrase core domain-containing protein [Fodinibius roseus]